MDPRVKLLSLAVVFFFNVLFLEAIVPLVNKAWGESKGMLVYFLFAAFFGALYFRRRLWLRQQRGGLYRGLGYTAVMLGSLISALLVSCVATTMPLFLAVFLYLAVAVASCFFYLLVMLPLEEEEVQLPQVAPV